MSREPTHSFVSRAGIKLAHALDAFASNAATGAIGLDGKPIALGAAGIDPRGLRCADFGCNKGGFTDCLIQRGAASVIALDTGYNMIDFKLRRDPRVTVRERTNALFAEPPSQGVDLVVIDLAWTPQRLAVPAALRWIAAGAAEGAHAAHSDGRDGRSAPNARGHIITLVKPHYELHADEKHLLQEGFLAHDDARRVMERVASEMPSLGARVIGSTESPITGGKTARARGGEGNLEFLLLLQPA